LIISLVVTLKKSVLDPQGKTIQSTLNNMGYKSLSNLRQGKYFTIELNETDKSKAENIVKEMCEKLLVNQVIEDYKIDSIK
jgi:phosphoribosylformylglycinamidine synthase PurS subunit